MAEFRGTVTRLGSKKSGIEAHINSWKAEIDSYLWTDSEGIIQFKIYAKNYHTGQHKTLLEGTEADLLKGIE